MLQCFDKLNLVTQHTQKQTNKQKTSIFGLFILLLSWEKMVADEHFATKPQGLHYRYRIQ